MDDNHECVALVCHFCHSFCINMTDFSHDGLLLSSPFVCSQPQSIFGNPWQTNERKVLASKQKIKQGRLCGYLYTYYASVYV